MDPLKVSAQFAAFVWFSEKHKGTAAGDAARFARENWIAFLPCAEEGLGRLLLAIAGPKAEARWPPGVNDRPRQPLAVVE